MNHVNYCNVRRLLIRPVPPFQCHYKEIGLRSRRSFDQPGRGEGGDAEELDRLDRVRPSNLDIARLKKEMKIRLAETQTLLRFHVSESRKILRMLFDEPIQCTAVVQEIELYAEGHR